MTVGIAYLDGPRLARSWYAAADWLSAGRQEINRIGGMGFVRFIGGDPFPAMDPPSDSELILAANFDVSVEEDCGIAHTEAPDVAERVRTAPTAARLPSVESGGRNGPSRG